MRRIFLVICLIVLSSLSAYSQKTIQLEKDGGVYRISCLVNGAKMKMIFDTGASMVCLSKSMAEYLYENEYISDSDILGTGKSQVADGRIVDNLIINIRDIEISGMHLKNVRALVSENQQAPLLLGMTAIEKLGDVTLRGEKLVINSFAPNNKYSTISDDNLFSIFNDAFKNHQYYSALEALLEINNRFDPAPLVYYKLSYCYFATSQYQECINTIREMEEYLDTSDYQDEKNLFAYSFDLAGQSCERIELYQQAIGWYEKSLSIYQDLASINEMAHTYSNIGSAYKELGNKYQAIDNYKKAIEHQLHYLNKTEYDVFKSTINDELLGFIYIDLFFLMDNKRDKNDNLILSARCGYRLAQEMCIENGLRY